MIIKDPTACAGLPRPGLTLRGLLKGGLGFAGVAELVLPPTGAFAAVEAANEL